MSKMSTEYIRGKSWVELMEAEAEEERLQAEKDILEEKRKGEEERQEAEEERQLVEEERLEIKEERLCAKEERLKTVEEADRSKEQKVNNQHPLALSENCSNDMKEGSLVSAVRIKTEVVSSSPNDETYSGNSSSNDKAEMNNIAVKNLIPKEKIKIEPETHTIYNEDYSPADIKQDTSVINIKIKSEVEEIDDDDRISKELEIIEHDLSHVHEVSSDSMENMAGIHDSTNSVSNCSEKHTFVHPETMVNGDHKSSDTVNHSVHVSTSTQTSPRKNRSARKRKSSSNVGGNRRKFSCRDPSASSSSSGRSSNAGDNKITPRKEKKQIEYETNPEVLARRQKQIDYGKNTIGYDRYRQLVPKEKRTSRDPRTPPKNIKYSRRAWDGMVRIWRQQLHVWDPVPDEKQSSAVPNLNVSVDVTSTPYKRRIHTSTVSSASGSGSIDDVGTDDFISLDYDYTDL